MRYHPEDKQKTRHRILTVAARRYRAEGFSSVGIANLMADLGMTHGGFYAHFTDKEALVASACEEAFIQQLRQWRNLLAGREPLQAWKSLIDDYLSARHREHPETGCFAAALAGEMARRDNHSRQAFTGGVKQLLACIAEEGPADMAPEAMFSLMVGAMMLSRAVSDPELAARFLREAAAAVSAQSPA